MDNYTDDFMLYKRIQGVSVSTLKDYEYALNKFYAEGGDLTKGAVNGWIKRQLYLKFNDQLAKMKSTSWHTQSFSQN